jgi:mRNA-degrading endonuclease RelE of RelBE toxin-antitoxin system
VDYKNLRNPELQQRAKEEIKTILESDQPRSLGSHKIHNIDCVYGYDIGQQYRILYEVFDGKKEVAFYRIGLHNIYKSKLYRLRKS